MRLHTHSGHRILEETRRRPCPVFQKESGRKIRESTDRFGNLRQSIVGQCGYFRLPVNLRVDCAPPQVETTDQSELGDG